MIESDQKRCYNLWGETLHVLEKISGMGVNGLVGIVFFTYERKDRPTYRFLGGGELSGFCDDGSTFPNRSSHAHVCRRLRQGPLRLHHGGHSPTKIVSFVPLIAMTCNIYY